MPDIRILRERIAKIPSLIRSWARQHECWIVGSGAQYITMRSQTEPGDWDVLVEPTAWPNVAYSIPSGAQMTKFNGVRFTQEGWQIDVWSSTLIHYFSRLPDGYPPLAVNPDLGVILEATSSAAAL